MINRKINSSGCSLLILRGVLLSHEFYIHFNPVACDFVRFHLIVILKHNLIFSFNILTLIMTVVSVETFVGRTKLNLVASSHKI